VVLGDTSGDATATVPAWVSEGYATLFREAAAQSGAPFDVVVVPVGVGSLAAAALRERGTAAVIAVEPRTAACVTAALAAGTPVPIETPGTSMAGLDCALPSAAAWPALRAGLRGTITVSDPEAHDAMRELAALGLAIGDCGAAPLAALRALVADPECAALREAAGVGAAERVLLVATEGITDPDAYREVISREGQGGGQR
jgi:diaminopropionate ammonia-lyase